MRNRAYALSNAWHDYKCTGGFVERKNCCGALGAYGTPRHRRNSGNRGKADVTLELRRPRDIPEQHAARTVSGPRNTSRLSHHSAGHSGTAAWRAPHARTAAGKRGSLLGQLHPALTCARPTRRAGAPAAKLPQVRARARPSPMRTRPRPVQSRLHARPRQLLRSLPACRRRRARAERRAGDGSRERAPEWC